MISRLPWTKFQDFYLRLGFLKALVAALSAERRSTTNDAVIRRLRVPLFDSVGAHPALAVQLGDLFRDIYPRRTSSGKTLKTPEVAEALVALSAAPSALYGITHETTYKILDWGHDVELIGRANQITERGLLLKSLWPTERSEAFFAGNLDAWNPLDLTLRERLFFLYLLTEIDILTVLLIHDLGSDTLKDELETRDAARLTCRALVRVLEGSEHTLKTRDIAAFRTAQELAVTIAGELDESVPETWREVTRRLTLARRVRQASKARARMSESTTARKTTKNADHQTIPRFEILVDLGFLTKPGIEDAGPHAALAARRRWRYQATDACRRWAAAWKQPEVVEDNFRSRAFARTAVAAFHGTPSEDVVSPPIRLVGERLWESYTHIKRSAGLSPLDSIALIGMINAAAEGTAIEMVDFHHLMLRIKESNLLSDCVHFASGNALDAMFIQLRPSFPQRFAQVCEELGSGGTP